MFMRSLLTGTALLGLVAMPALAAGQAPAANPASTVTSTATTSTAKPATKTDATKPASMSAEKTSTKTAHKHWAAMHKSHKKVTKPKADATPGTTAAKPGN